jgi:hypothetical protein
MCLLNCLESAAAVPLPLQLMAQPPWDSKMELSRGKPYYILHYTYGNDYTLDGKHTPGGPEQLMEEEC